MLPCSGAALRRSPPTGRVPRRATESFAKMGTLRTTVLTLAGAAALAAGAGLVVVYAGLYDVAATRQHLQPVYSLLETAMRQSVRLRARSIEPPPLHDEALVARGARCYHHKCVQCHGGPGVAQGDIGKAMQPLPGPLADAGQRWQPRELYWVTRHGIKMSGMPAWEFRLSDEDIWSVVAFVQALPTLSPQRYAELAGREWTVSSRDGAAAEGSMCGPAAGPAGRPADVQRGRRALHQYACNACHTVPGVTSSHPQVGPSLAGVGRRTRIAGVLDNTPENMVRWLRYTQDVKPGTAMPKLNVTEQDAIDMTAYLLTLK